MRTAGRFALLAVAICLCAVTAEAQSVTASVRLFSGSNYESCDQQFFSREVDVDSCVSLTDEVFSFEVRCLEDNVDVIFYAQGNCEGASRTVNIPGRAGDCFALPRDSAGGVIPITLALQVTCMESVVGGDNEEEDDDEICFAAHSKVRLMNGAEKELQEVQVGDMVESFNKDGDRVFSEVFMVQHGDQSKPVEMRRLAYSAEELSGAITVSGRHLIAGSLKGDLVRADTLREGSQIFVQTADGPKAAYVTQITKVFAAPRNVHTMNDHIVVDGVLVSPFTDLHLSYYSVPLAKMLLAPLKGLHLFGLRVLVKSLDLAGNYIERRLRDGNFVLS
mmetsp:Transcript_3688/g.11017  ORF Transcript_3688/g.11017 Transcript_3688/m.11017 type:complete len:334 (+) Transcript_3688:63-1064(+)